MFLAFDLGTGGSKASLHDADGVPLASAFVPYPTLYPAPGLHEQRPEDWWEAIAGSARKLLAGAGADPRAVRAIGISGHSLGVVPLDREGRLLRETAPIWSDSRPGPEEIAPVFERIEEGRWYEMTGCGFPPALYPIFKLRWYRHREPAMFGRIGKVLGTKDTINHRLTGRIATDPSYASGSGLYDIATGGYSEELLAASGLPREILPDIVPSSSVLGGLTAEAAGALGLPRSVAVVAGGVDNSCMALGARAFEEGRCYNSLGSSSWIAVSSARPVIDRRSRPYVFAHVVPGLFASATAIFSAGTSFRWIRDRICPDLAAAAEREGKDPYDALTALAAGSPPGARGLLFNPSLAGGSGLDPSPRIRGAFLGLDLAHGRADLVRAAMEGIALGLRVALDELRRLAPVGSQMVVVGGGARSPLWRRILADALGVEVLKTSIDQGAAALGAAAVAAVGTGTWKDYRRIDDLHRIEDSVRPDPATAAVYERMLPVYRRAVAHLADLADLGARGLP